MTVVTAVTEAVDRAWQADEKGSRPHLGASQVGKPCLRALVYSFRHATVKKTEGRMLRLFDRGHREEHSINASLRRIGMEVREYADRLTLHIATQSYGVFEWDDPTTVFWGEEFQDVSDAQHHVQCAEDAGIRLRQWAFRDVGGHHAGSTDGKAMIPEGSLLHVPSLPQGDWFGLEFKTYNAKSFSYLLSSGTVREAKPEHYVQMQEYMHYMGLKRCLYIAVCKNDDQWYCEVVSYAEAVALAAIDKARAAISARQLPKRYSDNSSNVVCKFCDHKGTCHFGEPLVKSCRTCTHVSAVTEGEDARWHCGKWNALIPVDAVKDGCDTWTPVTD